MACLGPAAAVAGRRGGPRPYLNLNMNLNLNLPLQVANPVTIPAPA